MLSWKEECFFIALLIGPLIVAACAAVDIAAIMVEKYN